MTITDMSEPPKKNGNGDLPAAREAIIEQAQRIHQEVAHERDQLLKEVARLRSEIAAHKVTTEAQRAQMAEMESRMVSAYSIRDEQIGEAQKYKTICRSAMAIFRAAEIENEPLIINKRPAEEEESVATIGGA